jgi:hypothetical protein
LVREKIKAHPNQTLLDFFKVYSPAEDNKHPKAYAAASASVWVQAFTISNLYDISYLDDGYSDAARQRAAPPWRSGSP